MSGIGGIGAGPRPGDIEPEDVGADDADAAAQDDDATAGAARTTAPKPPRAELVAAKATAERLGEFLKSRLDAAGVTTMSFPEMSLDAVGPFFEKAFGPALPAKVDAEGRTVMGQKLIMKAGNTSGMSPIESIDGHPLMKIASLTSSGAFFYVSTLVDLVTGDVYQEKSKNGGGSGPLTIFGPLAPPEGARLTGSFSGTELYDLGTAVTRRVR